MAIPYKIDRVAADAPPLVWPFCAVRCHRGILKPALFGCFVQSVAIDFSPGRFMSSIATHFVAISCMRLPDHGHFVHVIASLSRRNMAYSTIPCSSLPRLHVPSADPLYTRYMPESSDSSVNSTRITVSREVRDSLKTAFPSLTFDEAVSWLLSRYRDSVGDSAAVAGTELWIKLDRLEEACSLLALTNIDIADGLRRQVSGELDVVRASAVRLATIAATHDQTGGPR